MTSTKTDSSLVLVLCLRLLSGDQKIGPEILHSQGVHNNFVKCAEKIERQKEAVIVGLVKTNSHLNNLKPIFLKKLFYSRVATRVVEGRKPANPIRARMKKANQMLCKAVWHRLVEQSKQRVLRRQQMNRTSTFFEHAGAF